MLDRLRHYSITQKVILAATAVLLTGCILCCGCSGLASLLPSGNEEAVAEAATAEASDTLPDAEIQSEPAQLESVSESVSEPTHTPSQRPTAPPPATKMAGPTNTPTTSLSPANTATLFPSPTSTTGTEPTTLGSAGAVAGDLAAVVRIIDGDTIEVEMDGQTYRVRYIGMDTPERGDYFYDEATAANRQLVEGQTVTLVKDVSETDRYGRLLRYVYLSDGTFVNAELVRQGYAQIATFPPDVANQELFVQLQQEAREAGRGLWSQAVATLSPATQPPQPTSPPLPTNTPLPAFTATTAPQSTNTPEAAPTAVPIPPTEPPPPPPSSNCDPSYPTVCIPPPPPDLDCGQIPHRDFTVLEPDPHGFDRDNDGIGCES